MMSASKFVRVDRTVPPMYTSSLLEVLDPELENEGPVEFDCSKLKLWFYPVREDRTVRGHVIRTHLKSKDMLSSCLGLRDLEEIQKKGIHHFREHFKGQEVFGWKSCIRDSEAGLVPCIRESGDRIVLRWHSLGRDWSPAPPVLRFA